MGAAKVSVSDRVIWAKNNPTACVFPFVVTNIQDTPLGINYSCCCNLDRSKSSLHLLETLKHNIKNKLPTPECRLCYSEENKGNQSERIRGLISAGENEFQIFSRNLEIDSQHHLHIKFSNLCPLSCRSCGSFDSSGFAKIARLDVPEQVSRDLTDDPAYWEIIKRSLIDLHDKYEYPGIQLIGGETLIQPGAKKTLQWLIDNGMAQKFIVTLTTSIAVNLSSSIVDLLGHFYQVGFCLSIDSVGENYHYVRWPASFSKIEGNLEYIMELHRSEKIKKMYATLNPVFSLNNVFYINDYLDYFYQWTNNNEYTLSIHNIHLFRPEILAIETLPPEYRLYLSQYLRGLMSHEIFADGSQPVIKSFLESLEKSQFDLDDSSFIKFLKFTAEFDQRTGTSFSVYNQRLWDILSDHHKDIYNKHLTLVDVNINIHHSLQKK